MLRAVLSLCALGCLSAAWAGDKPQLGPPPPWVESVPIPADDGTASDAAVRFLLTDWQVNFSGAAVEAYFHNVVRVQTPQGLTTAGTISLPWNPATDSLTVHHLQILRGAQVIDVLVGGQSFTVLRRENSLEYATLSGILTAVIQPAGLQVGDLIDMAFTLARSDPVLGGNSELVVGGWPNVPIAQVRFRGRWTAPAQVQWWASDGLPKLQEARRGGTTEISFTLDNPVALSPPKGAPARFRIGRQLQLSSFKSWQQIAERLGPFYVKAATLSAQSPLNEELTRIRAAAPDPAARAMAALRLVQDQVRYVFLGMNDGALVPTDADLTWSRRFGDCKGKTALLLALLHALDIPAEPVAVNTLTGDSVKSGLPMIEAFNHVLVRATIGGKLYWMDGARSGDRQLAELTVPPYYWGLPLTAKGGTLVQIVPTPLAHPLEESTFTIDASGGIPGPAPVHAECVLRGEAGALMRFALGNLSAADRDKLLREFWAKIFSSARIDSVAASFDEQSAQEHLTMAGSLPLDWDGERLALEGLELGSKADLTRPSGPQSDAPFSVQFPSYSRVVETIKLPHTQNRFAVDGEDIHRTIAGVEFKRETRISAEVLSAEASARTVGPEIPSAGIEEARQALREVTGASLYLLPPQGYVAQQRAAAAGGVPESIAAPPPLASASESGADLIRHGNDLLDKGEYGNAIRDFDKALQLEPRSALALADRAMAHIWRNEVQLARADLDAAVAIDPGNVVVPRGRGVLALRSGQAAEAVADFTEALRLEPESAFALQWRAQAYRRSHDYERALSDSAAALRLRPQMLSVYLFRESLLLEQGRPEEALREAEAVTAANPNDAQAYLTAANIYLACGKDSDARRALDRSLALAPTLQAYLARARYRPKADFAGRQADSEAALGLDSRSSSAMMLLASAQSDAGKYADAEATLNKGLALLPEAHDLLINRGIVYAKSNQPQRAAQDFAAVRDKIKEPPALNNMCWSLATAGVALETALSACDAALAAHPGYPVFLDSRGFVLLRLGRYDEAIASYDAALKDIGNRSVSLYGRGLAKRLKGDTAAGDADLRSALQLNAHAAAIFADYGLTP